MKRQCCYKIFIASTMQTEVFKNCISLLGWYCYSCDAAIKIELSAMIKMLWQPFKRNIQTRVIEKKLSNAENGPRTVSGYEELLHLKRITKVRRLNRKEWWEEGYEWDTRVKYVKATNLMNLIDSIVYKVPDRFEIFHRFNMF